MKSGKKDYKVLTVLRYTILILVLGGCQSIEKRYEVLRTTIVEALNACASGRAFVSRKGFDKNGDGVLQESEVRTLVKTCYK